MVLTYEKLLNFPSGQQVYDDIFISIFKTGVTYMIFKWNGLC